MESVLRVIELVKVRDRDLFACADRETQPLPQVKTTCHQPRRDKHLLLSDQLRPIGPESHVGFQFRPQLAHHAILERRIVRHGSAAVLAAPGGNGPAQSALKVEVAVSLAEGDGRRNRAVGRAKRPLGMLPARNAGNDVVAVLFVAATKRYFRVMGYCRSRSARSLALGRRARQG